MLLVIILDNADYKQSRRTNRFSALAWISYLSLTTLLSLITKINESRHLRGEGEGRQGPFLKQLYYTLDFSIQEEGTFFTLTSTSRRWRSVQPWFFIVRFWVFLCIGCKMFKLWHFSIICKQTPEWDMSHQFKMVEEQLDSSTQLQKCCCNTAGIWSFIHVDSDFLRRKHVMENRMQCR